MTARPVIKLLAISLLLGLFLSLPGVVKAQDIARVGFFEEIEILPGSQVAVPVEVSDVLDLYAVDLEIHFDPNLLQVADADENLPGVQPALGTFLDVGLTLFNEVDNTQGVIRFAMSQVNPSEPKSGEGVLLVLYLIGLREGETGLEVRFVDASDRYGDAIPVEPVDGVVTVTDLAGNVTSLPIPIQDPTMMIAITPSFMTTTPETYPAAVPSPQPTGSTLEATDLPEPTGAAPTEDMPEVIQAPQETTQSQDQEVRSEGFSIVRYWWLVLILFILIIVSTVYMIKIKKS
jgi:hypothetical protein